MILKIKGMQKVRFGITTPTEVVRAAYIASLDK